MLLNLILSAVIMSTAGCRNKLYMKKKVSVWRRLITLTIRTALVGDYVINVCCCLDWL